jgi:glycosyltransferase involved in cell wall biosynthesis
MINLPRISVITPSFNQAAFLEETILSVLGQQYPHLEYIVMDGGSSDGSDEIIGRYAPQLSYWQSRPDGGQADALNQGFTRASGDILLWVNSDDILMPAVLHKIARWVADASTPQLWMGNCVHFSINHEQLDTRGSRVPALHREQQLSHIDYIIQPATCFTRAAWQLTGPLRSDLHFAFDWEWFLRAQQAGVALHTVADAWALYRLHPGHKSGGSSATERRAEILGIYQAYDPRMAGLYALLMQEALDYNSTTALNIRRMLKAFGRNTAYGDVLKSRFPTKYKSYSADEVSNAAMML